MWTKLTVYDSEAVLASPNMVNDAEVEELVIVVKEKVVPTEWCDCVNYVLPSVQPSLSDVPVSTVHRR